MAEYVQLDALRTWNDEQGSGDPLVLMHGGLVDARFFEPNLGPLAERFHVYAPERHGHVRGSSWTVCRRVLEAGGGTRTLGHRFTRAVLCQLSYSGAEPS
jgi:pimeloyl-ACP methyl ester carboxylesterase